MRKCIIAVLILICVIATCVYTATFTSSFCSELETAVSDCINNAKKEDWHAAEISINDAISLLNKQEHIMETFVMHHDIDEIHSLVFKTASAISLRNRQICISEAEYLLARIRLISAADKLTFSNIL